MKIVIDENEIVYLNDKKLESEQLNSEFLESVVYNGLDSKLDLEIKCDETLPIAKLFLEIKDMVKSDSDFNKQIAEIKKQKETINNDEVTEAIASELTVDQFLADL